LTHFLRLGKLVPPLHRFKQLLIVEKKRVAADATLVAIRRFMRYASTQTFSAQPI
jgi:hypothetical protein